MGTSHRLFKTLTGLVVAMTSTAALLAWINPASSIPPSRTSLDDLREIAQSAVREGVENISERWQRVTVRSAPQGTTNLLAATAPSGDHHFHVDADGHATRTHRWRNQVADRRAPQTVRIQVQPVTERGDLSVAQAATVRAIVEVLEEFRPHEQPPLRVVEEPGAASLGGTPQLLGQRL